MGFPKIRATLLTVPIIKIIVFGGLYWSLPILGNDIRGLWANYNAIRHRGFLLGLIIEEAF